MPNLPKPPGPGATEALLWLRAAMRAERPHLAAAFTNRAARCDICHRRLDDGTPASFNCGGTCRACMADAGDPDCIASLARGLA